MQTAKTIVGKRTLGGRRTASALDRLDPASLRAIKGMVKDIAEVKQRLEILEATDRSENPVPPRGYFLVRETDWWELGRRITAAHEAGGTGEFIPRVTDLLGALSPMMDFISEQLQRLTKRVESRRRDLKRGLAGKRERHSREKALSVNPEEK